MSRLLDDDQDLLQQRDRELTLSTGAILAIFLGLVILCALFFGFGYNLGRKSTAPVPVAPVSSTDTGSSSSDSTFSDFKPSPSSPAAAPHESSGLPAVTLPAVSSSAPAPSTTTAAPVLRPASTTSHESPTAPVPAASHPVALHPSAPVPSPAHTAASFTPAAPPIAPNGAFVVQIAAISRKDDADLLIGALRAKGYSAAERSEPQDKLIHIQVGPFATRKDAEAMRERLVIDGYNAIVK